MSNNNELLQVLNKYGRFRTQTFQSIKKIACGIYFQGLATGKKGVVFLQSKKIHVDIWNFQGMGLGFLDLSRNSGRD